MERDSGHHQPPRGLLTTDTRDFRPERLDRTDRTEDLLHQIGKRHQPRTGGELPDVTDFVGRKGKLPTEVAKVVVPPAGKERGVIRDIGKAPKVAETPTWRQKGSLATRRPGAAPASSSPRSPGRARAAGRIPVRPPAWCSTRGAQPLPRGRRRSIPGARVRPRGQLEGSEGSEGAQGAQGAPRTWGSAAAERAPRGARRTAAETRRTRVRRRRQGHRGSCLRRRWRRPTSRPAPAVPRDRCRRAKTASCGKSAVAKAPRYSASSAASGGRRLARRRRRQPRLRRPQLQAVRRRRRRTAARRALRRGLLQRSRRRHALRRRARPHSAVRRRARSRMSRR